MENKIPDWKRKFYIKLEEDRIKNLEINSELIDQFIEFCKEKKIVLTKKNFDYIPKIGIIAIAENLLFELNKELIKVDEELVSLKQLDKFYSRTSEIAKEGNFFHEKYIAMPHYFFRRSFNKNAGFQPRFIEYFWKLEQNLNTDLSICLDPDRVRIDLNQYNTIELDTWYGAKFNQKIETIPNGTVKLKPPPEFDNFDLELFGDSIYSLDIKWTESNNLKTFQSEEFKSEELKIQFKGQEFYPVRYIHAEFDIEKKYFIHFDGAIHLYTESEYYQRRDSDLNFNEKIKSFLKPKTFKIFKINGKIDSETWIQLSSQFYSKNFLMYEYFEGEYPQHIKEVLERIKST